MTMAEQDRVSHIRSQDEATYSRVALEIVSTGDWLTPHILGRMFLQKPPFLYWLVALAVKLFGVSPWVLRLPSLLAGALGIAVTAAWCRRIGPGMFAGALFLLGDTPWQTMSHLVMMDALVACLILLALWFVLDDPGLQRPRSIAGFGVFTAAAILTKSVAGVIPILVLLLFAALTRAIPWRRLLLALSVVVLVAAPWHVYQIVIHPEWFTTEYIANQLFGFGLHPPAQPTSESPWWFYARRLFLNDPVLTIGALLAVPVLVAAMRRHDIPALLLSCWLAIVLLAMMAFQSRSFLYAILLLVPMAILASGYSWIPQRWLIGLLLAAAVLKIAVPGYWSPAFPTDESLAPLRAYAARHRPNELIIVQPDDEFFSMLQPIAGVRYVFLDSTGALQRYAPHLAWLGITMTASEFLHYDQVEASYLARLRSWRLNDPDPLATSISAASPAEIAAMIQARPTSDFYLPDALVPRDTPIAPIRTGRGRAFLLAPNAPIHGRPQLLPAGLDNRL